MPTSIRDALFLGQKMWAQVLTLVVGDHANRPCGTNEDACDAAVVRDESRPRFRLGAKGTRHEIPDHISVTHQKLGFVPFGRSKELCERSIGSCPVFGHLGVVHIKPVILRGKPFTKQRARFRRRQRKGVAHDVRRLHRAQERACPHRVDRFPSQHVRAAPSLLLSKRREVETCTDSRMILRMAQQNEASCTHPKFEA